MLNVIIVNVMHSTCISNKTCEQGESYHKQLQTTSIYRGLNTINIVQNSKKNIYKILKKKLMKTVRCLLL